MSEKKQLNTEDLEKVSGGVLDEETKKSTMALIDSAGCFEDIAEYYKNLYDNRDYWDKDGDLVPFVENYLREKGYIAQNGVLTRA